jgi:hypothetical protein
MVLADSGRIARVPPYLGTPLGQSPVSATGLSPSVARLSRRLAYRELVLTAVPQPRRSFLRRFGLFRVRSPLLAESSFLSSPRGTEMFHFPRFARARLVCSARRTAALPAVGFPIRTSPDQSLVSGSPKLIAATRVLLRLLSPRHPSCALSSLVVVSSRLRSQRSSKPREDQGPARSLASVVNPDAAPVTHSVVAYSNCNSAALSGGGCSSCAYAIVKDRKSILSDGGADRDRTDDVQLAKLALSQLSYGPRWLVGLDRFELSTPRLSSVCSNQLSYRPIKPPQAPPESAPRPIFKEPKAAPSVPQGWRQAHERRIAL